MRKTLFLSVVLSNTWMKLVISLWLEIGEKGIFGLVDFYCSFIVAH
jgi:hypothetical protein